MYGSEDFERLFIRYKVVEVEVYGRPSPQEAEKVKDTDPLSSFTTVSIQKTKGVKSTT